MAQKEIDECQYGGLLLVGNRPENGPAASAFRVQTITSTEIFILDQTSAKMAAPIWRQRSMKNSPNFTLWQVTFALVTTRE